MYAKEEKVPSKTNTGIKKYVNRITNQQKYLIYYFVALQ